MTDEMPEHVRVMLIELAEKAAPREMCGFMHAGWQGITVMDNIADREDRFEIADGALLEFYQSCPDPLGFFHSHPSGRTSPSDMDCVYAPAGMRYWIVTPDGVYEWDMEHDPPRALFA